MTLPRIARLALCLALAAPALAAQDNKVPPKVDPKAPPKIEPKVPPVVVSIPGAASTALRPPLAMDRFRFIVQEPYAGGGVQASADGRYVALNRPSVMISFRNQAGTPIILRGTLTARLYRGTPPETEAVSAGTAPATPTVRQMLDDMRRYAGLTYSVRAPLSHATTLSSLPAGEEAEAYGRLGSTLDSVPSFSHLGAAWSPRFTVIAETNTLYTVRFDIAHETDDVTRYYRADASFRLDSRGRIFDQRVTYPPAPPPSVGRPSVEVRR